VMEKAGGNFDVTLSRVVDRHPIETLLTTFGFDNSMRSGGVIMVLMYFAVVVVAAVGAYPLIYHLRVLRAFDLGAAEGPPFSFDRDTTSRVES